MQAKGLDFLRPIWAMIYSHEELDWKLFGLNLSESDVTVTYTRYVNNYKKITKDARLNEKAINDAVEAGLTPGKNS